MMRRTRPRSRAAPTGVATGIPDRGRAAEAIARTRGAVGLRGDPQGGPRRSPRTVLASAGNVSHCPSGLACCTYSRNALQPRSAQLSPCTARIRGFFPHTRPGESHL
ncbi:hypothetical protein LEMLEM_LOCUS2790 [Lemmus lemmus]